MVVLQVQDLSRRRYKRGYPYPGGYEAAVSELVREGLVDSDRIGIIGFSRTCFYVMETLTTSTLHVKAASITDGVMGNYLQHMIMVDEPGFSELAGATIGAQPFGMGLQLWLKRSPLFNMDKVSAALQVVAEGRPDLACMWEPYAAMRYLHKPVDLILLNDNEHILSNPGARLASQGGAVDWMRFWLQDYEDPSPRKAEQYLRWRELRKLRDAEPQPMPTSLTGKQVPAYGISRVAGTYVHIQEKLASPYKETVPNSDDTANAKILDRNAVCGESRSRSC